MPQVTSKEGKPLQANFDHVERFLGFVEGDGLRALLLYIQLQMVLQVTANPWEITGRGQEHCECKYTV